MNDIELIEHHILIRETIGYELLSKIDVFDISCVMKFLKIVNNYNKIKDVLNKK